MKKIERYQPLFERKVPKKEIEKIVKDMTIPEIVRYDWGKIAFGFSEGDILTLPIKDINIKWVGDMENVDGFSMSDYFKDTPFKKLPLIEVGYENGKFHIEDGHHRYGYARELNLKKVDVIVSEIKDNPILAMGYNRIDDLIEIRNNLTNKT